MSRPVTAAIFLTVVVFILIFIFGWMHANIDSYFYYAIGEYFRTGTYPFQEPFTYIRPTTISPPLYGLFFVLTHDLPRADILLHALQLLLLAGTSYLLYRTLRHTVSKNLSIFISCMFALLPVNVIYAGNVMTEIPSQFFVMVWMYLVATGIKNKQPLPIAQAVFVSSAGTLMKYNLGIYVPLALLLLVPYWKRAKPSALFFPLLGMAILMGWILANHTITGVWGLYDTRGTQLYNQFVAQTKLIPPESDPSVIRMRSLLPPGTNIAVPYWDLQQALSKRLGYDWLRVDRVLFDVGWASVRTHPLEYIVHSLKNYALIHFDHVPHWENVGNIGKPGVTGIQKPFCGLLGTVATCVPVIGTPVSYSVWNAYVGIEMQLFRWFALPFFYIVLLPSLIWSLFYGAKLNRLYAISYISGTLPIAFTIHPDPRYIVPFYPLITLLVVPFLKVVIQLILWNKRTIH